MRSSGMVQGRAGEGFGALLWLSCRAQAPLIGLAAGFLALVAALGQLQPALCLMAPAQMLAVAGSMLVALLLTQLALLFLAMALGDRPKHPAVELLRRMARLLGDGRVMALGLPVLAGLFLFVFAFTALKASIPLLRPFAWDARLDQLDAALHLGVRPWQLLQPVLGHWPITLAISIAYHLWYVVMLGVWLQLAFHTAPGVARTRFLLAFMLLWMVGGGLVAMGLSSAGPCFFGSGHLGLTPDPYQGLTTYLRAVNARVPIWSLGLQQELWQLALAGSPDGSTAAMPSMHNGAALLFALAGGSWPRWVRLTMWAYVAVIFMGSVHLAWHYAVDGYVAWALALLAWVVAKPLAVRCEAMPAARRFRAAFAESPASL